MLPCSHRASCRRKAVGVGDVCGVVCRPFVCNPTREGPCSHHQQPTSTCPPSQPDVARTIGHRQHQSKRYPESDRKIPMPRLLKSFGTSTLAAGHGQAQPSVFETEFEPPPYFFVSNSQGRSCSDAGRTSSGNQAVKRPTLRT